MVVCDGSVVVGGGLGVVVVVVVVVVGGGVVGSVVVGVVLVVGLGLQLPLPEPAVPVEDELPEPEVLVESVASPLPLVAEVEELRTVGSVWTWVRTGSALWLFLVATSPLGCRPVAGAWLSVEARSGWVVAVCFVAAFGFAWWAGVAVGRGCMGWAGVLGATPPLTGGADC